MSAFVQQLLFWVRAAAHTRGSSRTLRAWPHGALSAAIMWATVSGACAEELSRAAVTPDRPDLTLRSVLAMAHLAYVPADAIRLPTVTEREIFYRAHPADEKKENFTRSEEAVSRSGFRLVQPGDPDVLELSTKEHETKLAKFYEQRSPHALLFVKQTSSARPIYVLAFRGSLLTWDDWGPNVFGFAGAVPSNYRTCDDLVKNVRALVVAKNGTLLVTGHSLGGGIAEYVAERQGLVAITFNSAHLSQPFVSDSHALVTTYHVIGRTELLRVIPVFGDLINDARLGGNFEALRLERVEISAVNPYLAHNITRFYDWGERLDQPLNPLANDFHPEPRLRQSAILASMPDFVAELPTVLQDSIHRDDINHCPVFTAPDASPSQLSDIWDVRFRVGYVRDSYPAGGLPIENLRVLDPPTAQPAPADSALSFDYQTALSHPIRPNLAWSFDFGHRSLSYSNAVSHDFSITRSVLGLIVLPGDHLTLTAATAYSKFKSVNSNIGSLLEGEFAASYEFNENKVLWFDASTGGVRRAGLAHSNGTVLDASAGFRWLLWQPTTDGKFYTQVRAFSGERTSDNARFADSQWGGGFGFTWKQNRWRAFFEPSARWTRHHLTDPAATKLFDRETVLRAELGYGLSGLIDRYQFFGWEIAAGYSWTTSDTAASVGSYSRRLLGVQLDKRY